MPCWVCASLTHPVRTMFLGLCRSIVFFRAGVRTVAACSLYSHKAGDRPLPADEKPSGVPSWRSSCSSIANPRIPDAKPSPEEMQALAGQWYAWMQKFSAAILPGGDGLKHSGRVLKSGLVTDGPYVEAKEIVVSFAIIQADDYDAALAIARECPPGHTIEIREFAGYA